MPNDALDIAIARYVRQTGMASADQLLAAMQEQARSLERGVPQSLAEVLVEQGVITPAQRPTIELRAKEQAHGVQQLLHYRLLRKLGEGGMGAVYLAEDTIRSRKVAVKVLPRRFADNPEFLKRFNREADASAKLRHENIVGAYSIGEDLSYHFYVMEYCEGETLDKLLKRDGFLHAQKATQIVLQVARGLQFAHGSNIIHRDIKPANIILRTDGVTKILDLGLSKSLDDAGASFRTATGAVIGTPHYISPEQARADKVIDGRSDIYSLGASYYHLVTGETPFAGSTAFEVISKHVTAQLQNPQDIRSEVPDGVTQIIRRMMAKEPKHRYPDCSGLITDLERALRGEPPLNASSDPDFSSVALPRKPVRGRTGRKRALLVVRSDGALPPFVYLAAGIPLVALFILLALFFSRSTPGPQAARAETGAGATTEGDPRVGTRTPAEVWKQQGPDTRPWRAIFDGRSMAGMSPESTGWTVENGALRKSAPARTQATGQGLESVGDGEVRFRFEGKDLTYLEFSARRTESSADTVAFEGPHLEMMEGRIYEVIIDRRGDSATATLDGQPIRLRRWSGKARGPVHFIATGTLLRILSIDYRGTR